MAMGHGLLGGEGEEERGGGGGRGRGGDGHSGHVSGSAEESSFLPTVSRTIHSTVTPMAGQDDPHHRNLYWRDAIRGDNSLYTNYEGGTLRAGERWRRGHSDM
ncbi:hypothetical protein BGZ94_006222, partial [Podila epigama]